MINIKTYRDTGILKGCTFNPSVTCHFIHKNWVKTEEKKIFFFVYLEALSGIDRQSIEQEINAVLLSC